MMNRFSYKTILVVDDEPDLRELIAKALELKGFKTLMAENGTRAYQVLQTQAVDMVISDIRMPGGDGVAFLRKAKQLDEELPFILITGFADINSQEAHHAGAVALICKPFNLNDLVGVIQKAFETTGHRAPSAA